MSKAILIFQETTGVEKRIYVNSSISIGRSAKNGICLNNKFISRHHAVLEVHKQIFKLKDLRSSNGTCINGSKIFMAHQLHNGDEILFGKQIKAFFLEEE